MMILSLFTVPVYADAVKIDGLTASIDSQTKAVKIYGSISSGQGSEVTVKITDPNGNLEYTNQITSGAGGSFEFSYILANTTTGIYNVYVGGYGITTPVRTSFEHKESIPVIKDSTISPIQASFDKNESNQQDISINMTLNGNTFRDIKNGNTALTGENDYSVSGSTIVIKKEYLATLPVGETTLTFIFSAGKNATLKVTIEDSTPSTPPSGGPSGGSKKPSEDIAAAVNRDGSVTMKPSVQLDNKTGAASSSVDINSLTKAFNLASTGSDGTKTINIEVQKTEGAKSYIQELPREAVTANSNQSINIVTELGSILIPGNMLGTRDAVGATNIGISISMADTSKLPAEAQSLIGDRPVIELNMLADGKKIEWSHPGVFVQVSIPYKPTAEELKDPEHIVIHYIDGNGNLIAVPNGRYDSTTGTVTFSTDHFSKYAVAYVRKTFSDIKGIQWAQKPIEVLASKGVINGTSESTFAPEANITRADFLVLLIRTLGLTAEFDTNFDDVKSSDYYYNPIGTARKLGITTGVGNNLYNPNAPISRQDMLTLAAKALKAAKKLKAVGTASDLNYFDDKNMVSSYAVDSIAALVKEGLIQGDGNNINPAANATRAETAVFMYRIYNK